MKKILLGTTGLFAAAMLVSSPASAAEKIKLGLGGYMETWVGFSDDDRTTVREFDTQNDSEVYFTGSTKLDNGLTVGVMMQWEADRQSRGRWADENFLYITSEQMGTLQLGTTPAVTFTAHHNAPDVGIGRDDADHWVLNNTVQWQGEAAWTGFFSDDAKVQYVSPSFSGFQVGAMYIPELNEGGGNNAMPSNITTGPAYGAMIIYNGDFEGVSVGFDAGIAQWDAPTITNEMDIYQVGLEVGFNGFTIGGGWLTADWGAIMDWTGYDLGASYSSGPYAASISWFHSEEDVTNSDFDVIMGSASYTMGPGVQLRGSIFRSESDNPGTAADNEGWGAVGGVKLSF